MFNKCNRHLLTHHNLRLVLWMRFKSSVWLNVLPVNIRRKMTLALTYQQPLLFHRTTYAGTNQRGSTSTQCGCTWCGICRDRTLAGKSSIGKISVSPLKKSKVYVSSVRDDGNGLDLDRISQRAAEKGLYTAEELESFSRTRLMGLIFKPGFPLLQN